MRARFGRYRRLGEGRMRAHSTASIFTPIVPIAKSRIAARPLLKRMVIALGSILYAHAKTSQVPKVQVNQWFVLRK